MLCRVLIASSTKEGRQLDENKTVESISAAVKKDPLAGWKKAAQYGATW